jgi:hypothetical protein
MAQVQARVPPHHGSTWRRRARRARAEIIRIERERRVDNARRAPRETDGLHLDMKRIQAIVQAFVENDETPAGVADELANDDTIPASSHHD